MRKIAIVFCLLGLLIGSTLGGYAIAQASTPVHGFIAISPNHGVAGTMVGVSGKGWVAAQPIGIYIDDPTPANLITTIWSDYEGKFFVTISMSAISVGHHDIIAVQDGMEGNKKFKVEEASY